MDFKKFIALVDEHNQEIGARPLIQIYQEHVLHQTRSVVLFVCNDAGQVWVTQVQKTEKIFPGMFFPSVLTYLEPGQTYIEALQEETFEQLGIDLKKYKKEELGLLEPQDSEQGFVLFYKVIIDVAGFDNNTDVFSQACWLGIDEIKKIQDMGSKIHSSLRVGLEKWFEL
jgi:hypothetical protein